MVPLGYSDRRCIGNMSGLGSDKVMGLLRKHRGRRDRRSILNRSVHTDQESENTWFCVECVCLEDSEKSP